MMTSLAMKPTCIKGFVVQFIYLFIFENSRITRNSPNQNKNVTRDAVTLWTSQGKQNTYVMQTIIKNKNKNKTTKNMGLL